MDRVKPDFAIAAHMAQQAIARTRDERKLLKERKKAEAAERQRIHVEAVAKRKQADIIFLGRGVSAGLADRRSNVEKLQSAGLPVLATPADVATALGLTIRRLRWLAFHSEAAAVIHYVNFEVPKRSGGVRRLSAPHKDLATTQEWILANILEKVPVHAAAHGFIPGRSTVTNAKPHVGRPGHRQRRPQGLLPHDQFPSRGRRLPPTGLFPAVATILGLLCTEAPRRTVAYAGETFHVATGPRALPQGACTSPALSNLVARKLDSRLNGIATKLGWQYTRYADDLTFSAEAEAGQKIGYVLARLRHIAQDEGFAVNEEKTRVQRPYVAQTVTGIVVNRRPGVDRDLVRRMRAILHGAARRA